jgi:hypothetical protein
MMGTVVVATNAQGMQDWKIELVNATNLTKDWGLTVSNQPASEYRQVPLRHCRFSLRSVTAHRNNGTGQAPPASYLQALLGDNEQRYMANSKDIRTGLTKTPNERRVPL